MDLEEFDDARKGVIAQLCIHENKDTLTAIEACEVVDGEWYIHASRKARRMDLLGDYAGTEPFVIDGMSLSAQQFSLDLLKAWYRRRSNPNCAG